MSGRWRSWGAVALVIAAIAPNVRAAEALMEEITITAQKREQPLQDVGIAVTAFTGQQIEQLGFQNSIDIVAHTPGMTFGTPTAQGNNANIALRGVALNDFNDNNESPVAVYIDGCTSARSQGPRSTVRPRRVEVRATRRHAVRPQRVRRSGAVRQRRTGKEFDGYGNLTLGRTVRSNRTGRQRADQRSIAARSPCAGQYEGYVHNRIRVSTIRTTDSNAGRLQVAFDITADLSCW
jgi:iron complex outermembrane receptor protein